MMFAGKRWDAADLTRIRCGAELVVWAKDDETIDAFWRKVDQAAYTLCANISYVELRREDTAPGAMYRKIVDPNG